MRKTLTALAVASVAATTFGGVALAADPSADCGGGPVLAPTGAQSGKVAVCVTEGPVTGSLSAEGSSTDPSNPTGYVVVDGDGSNPGALSGYIGIDSRNETIATGECSGNHSNTNHDEVDPARLSECSA